MSKICVAIMVSLALAAVAASASPLAAVGLDLIEGPKTIEWVHSTLMDGSAYSWRINIPSGRAYDGFIVGLRRPGSGWLKLDKLGRTSTDAASASLFAALEARAAATGAAEHTAIKVKIKPAPEANACYFPGWTADSFSHAIVAPPPRIPWTPIGPDEVSFRQVLPDPSLLPEGDGLVVCVAMIKADGTGCEGLLVGTVDEYLHDERAFFTSNPEYRSRSYLQKALALVSSTFDADSAAYFKAAALEAFPSVTMSDADWRLFEGDAELPRFRHEFETQFLNTIMDGVESSMFDPVFSGADRPGWFETLYGVNRQVEAASYVRYAFDVDQPLFCAMVDQGNKSYDWSSFRRLSADEGESLAAAAMALVGTVSSPNGEAMSLHGLGLLARALAATHLRSRVEAVGPAFPADNLAKTLAGQGPVSGGDASKGETAVLSFSREDIEKVTVVMAGLDRLRPGDLLIHAGSSEDGDEDPPQIAIVVSLPEGPRPAPGTDPRECLSGIVAVTIRSGDDRVSMGPLLGGDGRGALFGDPLSFSVRRLVAKADAPSK